MSAREKLALIRFSVLGSGSSGNAVLAASSSSKILIDNGLSLKQLRIRVAGVGESLEGLAAVFVTHEHADHVAGLGVLARSLDAPVYMTSGTAANLPASVGRIPRMEVFDAGDTISLDGMALTSFSVSHDAADPVNYVIEADGVRLGIASDMGAASQVVRSRLAGSHALIIESNHCPQLLRRGRYSPALQQRIRSTHGHLSNQEMSSLLAHLAHAGLQLVVLAHLSAENNNPELAFAMATVALDGYPTVVHLARQEQATPLFVIRKVGEESTGGRL